MFQLGNTYRKLYKSHIQRYSAESVQVNTSDANRCHMSVAALLAGWFPPEPDQIFSSNLSWQPIPIHSRPKSEDKVRIL